MAGARRCGLDRPLDDKSQCLRRGLRVDDLNLARLELSCGLHCRRVGRRQLLADGDADDAVGTGFERLAVGGLELGGVGGGRLGKRGAGRGQLLVEVLVGELGDSLERLLAEAHRERHEADADGGCPLWESDRTRCR